MDQDQFAHFCKTLRLDVLDMLARSSSSHIGSCFSSTELLATLYLDYLDTENIKKQTSSRDRFIFSKGHAAAMLYAVLARLGFFPLEDLSRFCHKDCLLEGHVSRKVIGIEYSSGSLGHGVSVGCGLALAAKRENKNYQTVVLISDGELNEGSTWEGMMFASHHKLNQLTVIVDANKIQSLGFCTTILDLSPLKKKAEAFGFTVCECNGHEREDILQGLRKNSNGQPKLLIAHTVKGKGVSFMENELLWHYRHPSGEHLVKAKEELLCGNLLWRP